MNKLSTNLWFDKEARDAAQFYTSVFKDSKETGSTVLTDTPSGTVDVLTINLMGQDFMLISAGPLFKLTPAISFLVACDSTEEVEELWKKLSDGGRALMDLGSYPFSEKYGWTTDKFGLSWQIMYVTGRPITQRITPTLMFVGDVVGKTEEAVTFYTSVFKNSKIDHIMRYGKEDAPDKEGTVRHEGFSLEGQEFAAMDSAREHTFTFTEAISFIVHCKDQEEIDYYWKKLSADPKAEQCGWLKDKYGVSWQVVPDILGKMQQDKDQEKVGRVTQAFLKMKKFDIKELEKAYNG